MSSEGYMVNVVNSREVTLHDGDDFDSGYEGVFVVSGPVVAATLEASVNPVMVGDTVTVQQVVVSGWDEVNDFFLVHYLSDVLVGDVKVVFDAEVQLVDDKNVVNLPELCALLVAVK